LTTLTEQLRNTLPQLGALPDADYIRSRYQALYDQHLDRVTGMMRAITVSHEAITTIIDNYRTTEERLAATASDIDDALGSVSASSVGGVTSGGDSTHAG
jgi:hypothetical protein